MGGVLCALRSAAITVRDWAWQCAEVGFNFLKSIFQGFANLMSKVVDFIKDQFSKLHFHFCYSDQTASASTSTSEDGLTNRVEVNQKSVQVEVRYNQDERKPDEIQALKEQNLKNLEDIKKVVDQAFELMKADVQASANGDPAEQAKTAEKVKQFMNGGDVKKLIDDMDSAPSTLA